MWQRLKKQIVNWRGIGITVMGVTVGAMALQSSGALQLLECAVLDLWFRVRPPESGESRVVIVSIDESDISRMGYWPISDETLAEVLAKIKQQQAAVIGLNLYRNLPVEPGHQKLLQIYASTPNLIGIKKVISDANGPVVPPPPILGERNQIAASDLVIDIDGKVRRHLLSVRESNKNTSPTLGTKLALTYLATKNIRPENKKQDKTTIKVGKANFTPIQKNEGGYVGVDVGGYQILANFYQLRGGFPSISITDVLENRIPPNFFQGKIVVIGSTAESIAPRFYTPYTTNPSSIWFGVQIHADLTNEILSAVLDGRNVLRGVPEPLEWLWILLLSAVGTVIGWKVRSSGSAIVVIPITIASLFTVSYYIFLLGWWLTVASPFLALISAGLISRVYLLWKRLQLSHQKLEMYAQTLEVKVQNRTQELKEKNLALEKAMQEAEAANLAKSAFLANMSHELRTPLNAILGFSQLLRQEKSLKPEQTEYLDIINRSGQHLLGLINDVLEMSKIEAGKMVLNSTSFDLYNLLSTCKEMFKLKAKSQGLYFNFELAHNLPQYIYTDEQKLSQILINLLSNALKFTQQGSVILRASVVESEKAPITTNFDQIILRFEVKDTGLGIAPEEMEQLFAPFVQTATGRQSQKGTGLGLAISRELAQLMGGDITVDSTVGLGTSFQFFITTTIVQSSAILSKPVEESVIGLAPNQPSYRILVVDDIAENRLLLVRLLLSLGLEVQEAENREKAINIWKMWQPHLIFMDIKRPIIDGCEAIQRIKSNPEAEQPIIIVLTASNLEDDRHFILSIGCADIIHKPFQKETIMNSLSRHLGVQLLYEETKPCLEELEIENIQVSPDLIASLPADWLKSFYRATIEGDLDVMLELIDEIKADYNFVSARLEYLAKNFEFEKILHLMSILKNGYNHK